MKQLSFTLGQVEPKNDKLRVNLDKVSYGDASGFVYSDELTPLQLNVLGVLEASQNEALKLDVIVEYDTEYDDDIVLFIITSITVYGLKTKNGHNSIDLTVDQVNYDDLITQLETSGYDFYLTYLEGKADKYCSDDY